MLARITAAKASMKLAANVEPPEGGDVVIRTMPVRGSVVVINGLRFAVQSYSAKKGDLHLRLLNK